MIYMKFSPAGLYCCRFPWSAGWLCWSIFIWGGNKFSQYLQTTSAFLFQLCSKSHAILHLSCYSSPLNWKKRKAQFSCRCFKDCPGSAMDAPTMSEKGIWSEGRCDTHWCSTVVLSVMWVPKLSEIQSYDFCTLVDQQDYRSVSEWGCKPLAVRISTVSCERACSPGVPVAGHPAELCRQQSFQHHRNIPSWHQGQQQGWWLMVISFAVTILFAWNHTIT